jgi:hypothetical protein
VSTVNLQKEDSSKALILPKYSGKISACCAGSKISQPGFLAKWSWGLLSATNPSGQLTVPVMELEQSLSNDSVVFHKNTRIFLIFHHN